MTLMIISSALLHRERIRKGLEELYAVRPGGDTFMHDGIQRVSSLHPAPSLYLLSDCFKQRSPFAHIMLKCFYYSVFFYTILSNIYRLVSRFTMEIQRVGIINPDKLSSTTFLQPI